ncbi:MAG: N-acetylmuramoyl-L-alanine amidase [Gammaproteobacteria bacterium]
MDVKDKRGQFRRRFLAFAAAALLLQVLSAAAGAAASTTTINKVRLFEKDDQARVVFDLTRPVDYKLTLLRQPDRVVVDFKNTRLSRRSQNLNVSCTAIKRMRHAPRNRHDLRVVLDLTGQVETKSFLLPPNGKAGHRLVIDMVGKGRSREAVKNTESAPRRLRDVVVAIDAGHGGKDPGAIGRRGTREKDIVLSIARRLSKLINRQPGMRAVLTRDADVFLPLRTRIEKAREATADLFLSIHADASRNRHAKGSSVYVLSRNGASSEAARWLAQRENEADLIGGVSLDDKDDVLAGVLLDLSQTATMEASQDLGHDVLRSLGQIGNLHIKHVENAGFVVLKSPDIPSVLVETAFISNPYEENRLRTQSHQEKLARAVLGGIRSYFKLNAPPGTLLAHVKPSRHVIKRGETLSIIAQRYQVSVADIRNFNELRNDRIRTGQVLVIPVVSGS